MAQEQCCDDLGGKTLEASRVEWPVTPVEGIDRSSLTDKVYALLKKRILSQILLPGQKVDLDRLASDLGISRSPIKDALNRLASDGLVTVVARRGTFVAQFDLHDLLEMLDVRMALETHAVRLGAEQANPDIVQEMRVCLNEFERDFPDNQRVLERYDEFQTRDRRFHLLLVATAANRKLLEFCESIHLDLQMARAYYMRNDMEIERVHAEHRTILEAFEGRHGEAAAEATICHLKRVMRSLQS